MFFYSIQVNKYSETQPEARIPETSIFSEDLGRFSDGPPDLYDSRTADELFFVFNKGDLMTLKGETQGKNTGQSYSCYIWHSFTHTQVIQGRT